jgi:hypothetical protein
MDPFFPPSFLVPHKDDITAKIMDSIGGQEKVRRVRIVNVYLTPARCFHTVIFFYLIDTGTSELGNLGLKRERGGEFSP